MTQLTCWPFLNASTDILYGITDGREPGVRTEILGRSDSESSLTLNRVGWTGVLDGLVPTNCTSGSVCTRSFSGRLTR